MIKAPFDPDAVIMVRVEDLGGHRVTLNLPLRQVQTVNGTLILVVDQGDDP